MISQRTARNALTSLYILNAFAFAGAVNTGRKILHNLSVPEADNFEQVQASQKYMWVPPSINEEGTQEIAAFGEGCAYSQVFGRVVSPLKGDEEAQKQLAVQSYDLVGDRMVLKGNSPGVAGFPQSVTINFAEATDCTNGMVKDASEYTAVTQGLTAAWCALLATMLLLDVERKVYQQPERARGHSPG